MLIQLDNRGTKEWSIATGKSIRKKLAFILDNTLLEAMGVTALIRGDYTKAELEGIKAKIENEK